MMMMSMLIRKISISLDIVAFVRLRRFKSKTFDVFHFALASFFLSWRWLKPSSILEFMILNISFPLRIHWFVSGWWSRWELLVFTLPYIGMVGSGITFGSSSTMCVIVVYTPPNLNGIFLCIVDVLAVFPVFYCLVIPLCLTSSGQFDKHTLLFLFLILQKNKCLKLLNSWRAEIRPVQTVFLPCHSQYV